MDVKTTVVTAGDANFAWGTFLLVASMRMNGMKQPVLVGAMGWRDEMKRRVEALGGVTIFYSSMTAGFGNKIHTETKARNFDLFMRMLRLAQGAILACAVIMAAFYQPFIALWTKGDPALGRHLLTPVLMVLYFYVNQSRQMLMTFKSAA